MRTPKTFYPSPEIRLWLLREIARELGLKTDDLYDVIPVPAVASTGHKIASGIAKATSAPVEGFGLTLTQLVAFRLDEHEDTALQESVVTQWARALSADGGDAPARHIRHARLLAAATARAWKGMSDVEKEEAQLEQTANITGHAFDWILDSAELESVVLLPVPLN